MSDETCPKCGGPLEFDEVDIGVGVQRGNYRCDNPECGWTPPLLKDCGEPDE